MPRQLINNTPADSGLGDTLFQSMNKINAMTLELYAADSSFGDAIDLINSTLLTINDGSSILNHKHTISQINGLQAALNSKVSTSAYINDMMAVTASIQAINDALNDIIVILNSKVEEAPFSGITYGRKDGDWVQITAGGGTTFTGGTVSGATNFTNGLTATTISATTYLGIPTIDLSGYVPYVGATNNVQLGEFGLETSWDYGFAKFGIENYPNQRQIAFYNIGDGVSAPSTQEVQFDLSMDRGLVVSHNESSQPNNIQMSVANGAFEVQTQLNDNSTYIAAASNKVQITAIEGPNDNTFEVNPNQTYSKRLFVSDTGFEKPDNVIGQFYVKQEGAQYLGLRFDSYGDLEGTPDTTFLSNSEDGVIMNSNGTNTSSEFILNSNSVNYTITSGLTSSTSQFLFDRTTFDKRIEVPKVLFNSTTETPQERALTWNDADGTLDLGLKGGNVTLQVGQEQLVRVVNKTATNITLQESAYQAVRVTGAQGQRLKVDLAIATTDVTSAETIGLVTETILNNQEGFVTTSGLVRGINTTGSLQGETWNDGDMLYLSPTVAGRITKVKPVAPQHLIIIGYVVYAHSVNGSIYVKVDNGYELDELHNVRITGATANQVLAYTPATDLWENKTISTILGYVPVRAFKSGVDGATVTNTLTITPTYTQFIQAGTFAAGDVVELLFRSTAPGAKTSASSQYIYVNTTNNLTTGSPLQIAIYTSGPTSRTIQMERTLTVKGATTRFINPAGTIATDTGITAAMTTSTIDWTVDQYIIFAIGHTVADQTLTGDFYRITKN